jgi:hypothetical protein
MLRVCLALGVLVASGCPSASPPPAASAGKASSPSAASDKPEFDVAVDAPATAIKGTDGVARITVSPRAPWHVNLDYAPKIELEAPGVVFEAPAPSAKPERFDADGLAFAVPFRAQDKGKSSVAGRIKFAMCAEDACTPQTVPVEFTIDVGCETNTVC